MDVMVNILHDANAYAGYRCGVVGRMRSESTHALLNILNGAST